MSDQQRIAIILDALAVPTDSERVALNICDIFPDAPIYTSVFLRENTFLGFKIRRSIDFRFQRLSRVKGSSKTCFHYGIPMWAGGLENFVWMNYLN
ncbi:MAG: hypothetical protein NTZ74_09665 [Chloroflexi bacterium]|nr:hypothetical protein [Chloroflexota bacterium]